MLDTLGQKGTTLPQTRILEGAILLKDFLGTGTEYQEQKPGEGITLKEDQAFLDMVPAFVTCKDQGQTLRVFKDPIRLRIGFLTLDKDESVTALWEMKIQELKRLADYIRDRLEGIDDSVARVAETLNEFLALDSQAINDLFLNRRVPCNAALAEHPFVVVRQEGSTLVAEGGEPSYSLGVIGLINGILKNQTHKVAHFMEDDSEEITKFGVYPLESTSDDQ